MSLRLMILLHDGMHNKGDMAMATKKSSDAWKEAKIKCRLNQADIQMAKELGMTPKSLIKNIPSSKQQWKAPVKIWVRDLYREKFGKVLKPNPASSSKLMKTDGKHEKPITSESRIDDEDLPF